MKRYWLKTISAFLAASLFPMSPARAQPISDSFKIQTWDVRCYPGDPIYSSCNMKMIFSKGAVLQVTFERTKIYIQAPSCEDYEHEYSKNTIKRTSGKSYSKDLILFLKKWIYECGYGGEYAAGDIEAVSNLLQSATR